MAKINIGIIGVGGYGATHLKSIEHFEKAGLCHLRAAVIRHKGQVFIAQRPEEGLLGGMWEFPGGKTKIGETLDACLMREICEELGVDIEVGAPFGIYEHAFTHFRITLHAFECLLTGGTPVPHEHKDLRWVKPAELQDFPMGKIDRQIAKRLTARNLFKK